MPFPLACGPVQRCGGAMKASKGCKLGLVSQHLRWQQGQRRQRLRQYQVPAPTQLTTRCALGAARGLAVRLPRLRPVRQRAEAAEPYAM
jgi:hypothetical protein